MGLIATMHRRGRNGSTAVLIAIIAGVTAVACGVGSTEPVVASDDSEMRVSTTADVGATRLSADDLLDRARRSVVRVRNNGCGQLSVGSAWLAQDRRLVSNRHVVEGLRTLDVTTWDGYDLSVEDAQVAVGADISRIDGDWSAADQLIPLNIRRSRVEPGERIAILGYPEGNELSVSTGIAVGYAFDPELAPREILKLTTVVKPGNSGGPAVDMNGLVVGVVYAKELDTSESLVIPIDDVFGEDPAPIEPAPPCGDTG